VHEEQLQPQPVAVFVQVEWSTAEQSPCCSYTLPLVVLAVAWRFAALWGEQMVA
jgi:hypothetical protein